MQVSGSWAEGPALWRVFFSLRGTVSKEEWSPAIVVVASMVALGLSFLGGRAEEFEDSTFEPSLLLVSWCCAALYCATLLCAKRLLDCGRPLWLVLLVLVPGLILIAAYIFGYWHASPALMAAVSGYLACFAMPTLIACATCRD